MADSTPGDGAGGKAPPDREQGVAEYTEPAIAYREADDDGEAVVVDTNAAFEAVATGDGGSLAGLLDDCLPDRDGEAVAGRLVAGDRTEPVAFHDPDASFLPRVVVRRDTVCHLLFVELEPVADAGDTDGDEPVAETDAPAVGDSEAVAHVVSHDLRNPLDVAGAHLELARDEHDGTHLRRVAEAHERMEQIIRDVLTLARGERAIDASEGVDMGAVVETAWESVAADDVTVTVGDVPTTTADRPRVERLVENLLRNAVDHAGDTPTVEAGGLPDDAGFYVADDGDGISATARDAVFEPGYTESGSGTGLGLAIVRRIAAAHGWTVKITDSETGGARVEVWFDDPEGHTTEGTTQ
ncbi:sensor histidine kinase [Halobaculum sp. MBLA0143]|uniref:sensor histidine kinase n=1 Tax=Halobaculum sp. MBLA0143 TaxID=3079933 RepID=UPI0035256082